MTGPGDDEQALSDLSGLLLSEQSVDGLLDMIVSTAVVGLVGIDEASISLVVHDGEQLETVNATSPAVQSVDEVQYVANAGPCVQAIRAGQEIRTDLSASSPWPAFSEAARAAGFSSVWSIPLRVRDQTTGALNLYSRSHPEPPGEETARALARQAGVVLANAASLMSADLANRHLQEALENRDVIGQAKGILMVRESLSADAAFDVLRRASQESHRKLRDIAAEIVSRFEQSIEAES